MLRIVTPPASYPVTLTEAKAQLRVTDSSNDTLIGALIPAATKFCQSLVQRAFVAQTMEWVLPCWREDLTIPIAPVIAADVASITYVDWSTETATTLDPAQYVLRTVGGPCVRILPKFGTVLPLVFARSSEPIVVRFDAGYDDPADLPGNVKAAILLQIRHLYSIGEANLALRRDSVMGLGEKQWDLPPGFETLMPHAVRDLLLDEVW